jgi:hypothetical protein
MRFETKQINFFGGMVQIPIPPGLTAAYQRIAAAVSNEKTLEVTITVKRKKRSLTANSALWAMLQDLAVVLKTSAWELYLDALRRYGFYEDIAVVEEAAPRLAAVYRIVEPTGDVIYDSGYGKLLVYRCWRGSSTYDSKEFSHLLDMVIQEAKENGVAFLSEADKALLIDEMRNKENVS